MFKHFTSGLVATFAALSLSAQAPAIDGTFDASAWGAALSTGGADCFGCVTGAGVGPGAQTNEIYVTSDANYYYFAAKLTNAGSWMKPGFVVNSVAGGATSDPWLHGINYAHSNLPDFAIQIDFSGNASAGYAAVVPWTGSAWGPGLTITPTAGAGNIDGQLAVSATRNLVEIKVAKAGLAALGFNTISGVQFYLSGNTDYEHGVFDATPQETPQASWNGGLGTNAPRTTLRTYASVILPVTLSYFEVKNNGSVVNISWETASEKNNDYFEVRRSRDGRTFETIGQVKGMGNSLTVNTYALTDAEPLSGISYYQLAQVDFDGATNLSRIVTVNRAAKGGKTALAPNPALSVISLSGADWSEGSAEIFDAVGQLRLRINNVTAHNIDISELPAGTYVVRLSSTEGVSEILRFVKQ